MLSWPLTLNLYRFVPGLEFRGRGGRQETLPWPISCHILLVSLSVLPGPSLGLCLQSMPQSPSASVSLSIGLEGWHGTRQGDVDSDEGDYLLVTKECLVCWFLT